MRKFLPTLLSIVVVVALVFGMPGQSAALLISGTGQGGTARDIINAPEYAWDDFPGATNFQQQAFNERQGVTLARDIEVDNGWISEGTFVDSHMIFLNTPADQGGASDRFVEWVFDGEILGVMSDQQGLLEDASTDLLGHPDTDYPILPLVQNARGLEGNSELATNADGYLFSGNTLTLNMNVSEPGDWIRVVTSSNVPEPGTMLLVGLGLIGLAGLRRKLKK